MKKLLFTKERVETGIFRFFNHFLKIWKIRERYKTEKIRERADPYSTLISTLKKGEEKLFQKYLVFLLTK